MKYLVPFAVIATLLMGCESKKEVCAKWRAGVYDNRVIAKKLGLKGYKDPWDRFSIRKLREACSYYR